MNSNDCNNENEVDSQHIASEYLTTKEVASMLSLSQQTIHKHHCLNGEYFGLRPTKLPNRRLLWSRAALKDFLSRGAK